MTTRMEKVAEDVALTALAKATSGAQTASQQEALKAAFRAMWPIQDSIRPLTDAVIAAAQAASSCTGQDADTWQSRLNQLWQPAVKEVVDEYFEAARHSFRKGEHLGGAETLTDAVRVTLGSIAASRGWPHATVDDIYSTAVALGSNTGWPHTPDDFTEALNALSKEGDHLAAALGASMGLPNSITFGTYLDAPEDAEVNGLSFAETVIELSTRFAEQEPASA